MTVLITTLSEDDLSLIMRFHGHVCSMVLVGARLGKAAAAALEKLGGERTLPFGFFRGYGCSIDGVQVFTGCTLGNGNLVLLRGTDFSLTLTREGHDSAVLVTPLEETMMGARSARGNVLQTPLGERIMTGDIRDLFTLETISGMGRLSRFPEG